MKWSIVIPKKSPKIMIVKAKSRNMTLKKKKVKKTLMKRIIELRRTEIMKRKA